MSKPPSILPPNSSPAERALEQGVAQTAPDLSAIRSLMNPETCPPHLLGWLAWAVSVDHWNRGWDEATKRAVIRESVTIHRRKGTIGAVRRALAAIGFQIDVVEWWQDGSPPHTFRLDAFGPNVLDAGFGIDQALLDEILRMVEPVKPLREQMSVRIGEARSTMVGLRSGSRARYLDHREAMPALPMAFHSPPLGPRSGHRGRCLSVSEHRFRMD